MSHTKLIELQSIESRRERTEELESPPIKPAVHSSSQLRRQGNDSPRSEASFVLGLAGSDLQVPAEDNEALTQWNKPPINMLRTFAACWGLFVMGMNDAAYGALIPYLETYYRLSYTIISLIFLSPFFGYTCAALSNSPIHMKLGQRGVAYISPGCKLLAYIVIATHPPYPTLVVMYLIAGFGNGLEDAAWNAWIGPMANSNQIMGFLHGSYGLGATVSPLIATTMITKANLPWYTFYYVMIAIAFLELATSASAFWASNGRRFREAHPSTTERTPNRTHEALFTSPSARITWLCACFLLGYMGAEVSIGGWVVSFMLRERGGSQFASGMTETGFWLGLTIGRMTLGFVTPKIGERLAITIYLVLVMGLLILFWLVPSFIVSAIAVSLQGFFLGPLFPAAIVVATRMLPKHLHVSAIGFAAAVGGTGGAIIPFAVGAIAQHAGVKVLQPIVLGMFCIILVLWLTLPGGRSKND